MTKKLKVYMHGGGSGTEKVLVLAHTNLEANKLMKEELAKHGLQIDPHVKCLGPATEGVAIYIEGSF